MGLVVCVLLCFSFAVVVFCVICFADYGWWFIWFGCFCVLPVVYYFLRWVRAFDFILVFACAFDSGLLGFLRFGV